MNLLKRIAALMLLAVFAVGFFTAVPSTAETSSEADTTTAEYSQIDISGYKRWTGSNELKENQNYYIDSRVNITGEKSVTIPKNSKLLVKNGGSLTVYFGSSLFVKGELIAEPSASVIISGELVTSKNSAVTNHGTFTGTTSSVMHLSSTFLTGRKGITAFSGEVSVYRTGELINHNRFTISKSADVKLTGKLVCEKNGMLFLKGVIAVTMNGTIVSNGTLYLYNNVYSGGVITLGEGSRLYRENGGRFTLTKAGELIDNRNAAAAEIEPINNNAPSEYDSEPEKVHWIGIDVSRYQGAIDWKRVKASGVDFVLLRSSIGDGTDIISGEDIRFAQNAVKAKEAGLMVGAYHYLWAENVEDARKEARFFIKTIAPYTLDFPAILDFEEPSQQDNLTNEERTKIAKVFLEEVKNAGYYPMLYTNKSWATTYLNMNELSEYEVWLAEWFPSPSYRGDFGIWQYTPYGKVAGIEGGVDLDICYKNYRKIILDGGYNHLK